MRTSLRTRVDALRSVVRCRRPPNSFLLRLIAETRPGVSASAHVIVEQCRMARSDSNAYRFPSPAFAAARPSTLAGALKAVAPRLYQTVRSVYWMWRDREERDAPFPLARKLAMWRHGFRAESAWIYDFQYNDMRDYLDDRTQMYRCRLINPGNEFFEHKVMQRSLLLAMGFHQVETVAMLADGRIMMHPFSEERRYVSPAELEEWLIDDGSRFVVKPEHGWCGRNIFLLEARDGTLMRRRGALAVPFRLSEIDPNFSFIERWIEQGAFWRELFAQSANTIRVQTMWTPGDEAPFIARAVQRMGTTDTVPTDNWAGGGICAPIDLASGRVGLGRMHPIKGTRSQHSFTRHPDSGAQIEGAVLPHWDEVKETALQAASSLPVNRYVGWDIYVDATGMPIIGEANGFPAVDLLQVHGGLLADPAIRRFYEKTGTI
jgi:Sugar-transfer associated ATP-grasp